MLTGGIDLSVAVVASMAAYVMATTVSDVGWLPACLIALVPAALVGLVNGVGVGFFRVHPLIMTISMSLVVSGAVNVYARANITGGTRVPPEIAWLGLASPGVPSARNDVGERVVSRGHESQPQGRSGGGRDALGAPRDRCRNDRRTGRSWLTR